MSFVNTASQNADRASDLDIVSTRQFSRILVVSRDRHSIHISDLDSTGLADFYFVETVFFEMTVESKTRKSFADIGTVVRLEV